MRVGLVAGTVLLLAAFANRPVQPAAGAAPPAQRESAEVQPQDEAASPAAAAAGAAALHNLLAAARARARPSIEERDGEVPKMKRAPNNSKKLHLKRHHNNSKPAAGSDLY